MKRHFTATGFVVHDGRTLLHWHRKMQDWMPPGGHLLENEDPITGLLREIKEEAGLEVEVLPMRPKLGFTQPEQQAAPYTILIEESAEAGEPHQHIDLIYICRSLDGADAQGESPDDVFHWVDAAHLERSDPLPLAGRDIAIAEDVRLVALEAIRLEREART